MSDTAEKIRVESITSPGQIQRVNRNKYMAMRDAFVPVMPMQAPGMTVAAAKAALLPNLSQELFPDRAQIAPRRDCRHSPDGPQTFENAQEIRRRARALVAASKTRP